MKQLKFMLAAATAIGLATAAQAAVATTSLITDNYDDATAGAAATTLTGYTYAGDTADDNESVIKAGGYNGSANALQVNTGTDPLLRALDYVSAATPIDLTNGVDKTLYIDTMVQFTVTPDGETVTAGADDKLMIYLKEFVTEETTGEGEEAVTTKTYTTNLVVKAAGPVDDEDEVITAYDYKVANNIEPNAWYRLRVVANKFVLDPDAEVKAYYPCFQIYIAAADQAFDSALIRDVESFDDFAEYDDASEWFPSLKLCGTSDGDGLVSATLTYVGFAGEGLVDNLTAYTTETQTSVDFTFTLSWGDGVSAVTYTIDGDETGAKTPVNGQAFTVAGSGSFTISYTLNEWYTLNEANPTLKYDFAPNGSGSLNLATTKLTSKTDDAGNIVVNPKATVSEIQVAAGITSGAFAAENTSKGDLQTALNWKKNCNGSGKADINNITFNGVEPTSDEAEAYLLNCDPADLESKKGDFKLEISFNEDGNPVVVGPEGAETYKNGNITLKGKAKLDDAEWADKADGHKFFKAVLTK